MRTGFNKTCVALLAAVLTCCASVAWAGSDCRTSKDIVGTAAAADQFQTLVAAVQAADLADALKSDGPFTVFAPTDDAFARLPEGTLEKLLDSPSKLRAILKYHVVAGELDASKVTQRDSAKTLLGQELSFSSSAGVKVNNARVIAADIRCSNGIIHAIDTVLLPREDIVDVASSAGEFTTLLRAVEAAGLTDTLRGEGPFTLFAPTDDAFAALPPGTVERLMQNPEALRQVLTYHVVPGKVLAADVIKLDRAKTVEGDSITIDSSSGVTVDNARVVKTDILASNGVIHVIDRVILPKRLDAK